MTSVSNLALANKLLNMRIKVWDSWEKDGYRISYTGPTQLHIDWLYQLEWRYTNG